MEKTITKTYTIPIQCCDICEKETNYTKCSLCGGNYCKDHNLFAMSVMLQHGNYLVVCEKCMTPEMRIIYDQIENIESNIKEKQLELIDILDTKRIKQKELYDITIGT